MPVLNFPFEPGFRLVTGSDLNRMIEAVNLAFSQTAGSGTIGQPNGIASLDGSGKVPVAQIPALGANPSVTIGLTAKNGTATTYLRSDASPALDQSIAPTWTGAHKFTAISNATDSTVTVRSTTPRLEFSRPDQPDRLMLEYKSTESLWFTYTNAAGDPVLSPFQINAAVVSAVDAFFKAECESSNTDSTMTVVASAPQFDINKENGAADAKRWVIDGGTANTLTYSVVNDAGTTRNPYLTVARNGAGIASIASNSGSGAWAHTGSFSTTGPITAAGSTLIGVVASAASLTQSADVNVPAAYAVAVSGTYRVSTYIVMTRAATTSATLPGVSVSYTEPTTSVAVADPASISAAINQLGAHSGGSVVIQAQQGTNIGYTTNNYASSGATSMQYAVRVVIERLL